MMIALGHEAGVGKDTFAMFIIEYLRSRFRNLRIDRVGFADRVYDLCYSLYSWAGFQTRQYYQSNPREKAVVLPKLGKTPREIIIGIAEKVREFDPDCWLNAVVNNQKAHLTVISDMRKVNEFEKCGATGVYRVCIRKTGYDSDLPVDVDLRGHRHLFEETIYNDGTLNEFQQKAVEFTDRILVSKIQEKLRNGPFNA